ncbi:Ig-like domain-containing protein [Corynebacterium silvaticum]|uniref:Ig-like domain-containing protein n=1 Tax=Corynebacterium silvaticum TaxID=2320431 RepID=A0ACD4Q077_9CORY|nr:Ig-like domain-containing protein [Corynebacterium silvaticum]TFA91530.1 hypothetical protein EU802_10925 [Corynebacterium silvaticum]TFA92450.1 hypothetical protein EU799_10805 [Corynebacterium silvaticum]TNX78579.1 hypothetical protein FIT55_11545 [Corynebacterium silvaticum]TRM15179.1 hypothetical protein ET810_008345 [Corynebacterium silvaticum]WCV10596.1 Ig-like domain-containing protein [Corynebacterium silvaticum]
MTKSQAEQRWNLKWSVNEDAKNGDQFKVELPQELMTVATGFLPLKDENGKTVATAAISGGQKEVVFTLTDYVQTNFQVKGSAFFTVEWDHKHSGLSVNGFGSRENPGTLTFGDVVTVICKEFICLMVHLG